MLLTGCGGPNVSPVKPPADDATSAEAKAVSAEFKRTVAEVQEQILTEGWSVGEYGDVPSACGDDGYEFSMVRWLPDGFSFHLRAARPPVVVGRDMRD
ncbi:hypothetical protein ACFWZW_07820 [Microbacterium enclense]|uniref:hypothetical protein n=1 Tax=Microbacterium enclense TaxID=993073 RepID=UPI0036D8FCA8